MLYFTHDTIFIFCARSENYTCNKSSVSIFVHGDRNTVFSLNIGTQSELITQGGKPVDDSFPCNVFGVWNTC